MGHCSVRVLAALGSTFLVLAGIPAKSLAEGEGPRLKKIIAVARFENRTGAEGQMSINDAMADQLTDALMRNGHFTVLERQTVRDVLGEQDFANSGRVQKADSARTGKIVAAQVLVKGTITEYEGASKENKKKFYWGPGGFGNKNVEGHVGVMIRLIDTTSGEVIYSQRVEGKSEARGKVWSIGGYEQSNANKAPMDVAVQEAIDKAVDLIAEKLAGVPFETRVVQNNGNVLVIAAGSQVGAKVGDEFTVYSLGEEFIDPSTGESLGSEEEAVGTVRITQVKERYSKATPVGPLGAAKPGDIVRELPHVAAP